MKPHTVVQLVFFCLVLLGMPGVLKKACAEEPAKDKEARMGNLKAGKVLFLGNSITLHPPKADIGWLDNWGMAASAQQKDFVHLLINHIAETTQAKPETMIENIADFERQYDTYNVASKLKKHIEFKADLVIVAIGENVPAFSTEDAKAKFKGNLLKLLAALKNSGQPAIFVRSCFWPDKTKDEIMKQACTEAGGVFVDISSLAKDESNYARSERKFAHAGVAAHPGDKGMQAIADAIWSAIKDRASQK